MNEIEITTADKTQLHAEETTIETTQGAFLACGRALMRIRDKRLYRETFNNFEDYCQERWGWSRIRAHMLIEGAATVDGLPVDCKQIVNNEGQARALSEVPKDDRPAVVKAVAKAGKVTAAAIKSVADKLKPKPGPKPTGPLDEIGWPIPSIIQEDWKRAESESSEMLKNLSQVKCWIKDGLEKSDVIFREINNNALSQAKNLYATVSQTSPHAVCPSCNGTERKHCDHCKKRGWLSKFLYHAVPSETRDAREKAVKK